MSSGWEQPIDEGRLSPDLAAAVGALRDEGRAWTSAGASLELPAALRVACRQRRTLRTWRHGAGWAAAAAAASVAALVWFGPRSGPPAQAWLPPASVPTLAAPAQVLAVSFPAPATGAFLPLSATPPASGFVVRVDLPAADLASLGIAAAPGNGPVPAEVLMNDDGVPCGIRFLPASSVAATVPRER